MNEKIQFGSDYLYMATTMQEIANVINPNAFAMARVLLVIEWGFSTKENNEANRQYWKNVNTNTPDDFVKATKRLIEYVKEIPEAKTNFLIDVMAIANEENPKELKMNFIYMLRNELGFTTSELTKFMERSTDIYNIFNFLHNNQSWA